MILIDGKKAAAELREELKQEVAELKTKYNKVPGLTVILIGDMAPSQIYVRNKEKSANDLLREASKENDSDNEIFSSITLRGNRILIPEIASKISGFTPDEDVIITASKGKIIIKKF